MRATPKTYRLRQVAHFFAILGAATVVYSSVLVVIALQTAIIEF